MLNSDKVTSKPTLQESLMFATLASAIDRTLLRSLSAWCFVSSGSLSKCLFLSHSASLSLCQKCELWRCFCFLSFAFCWLICWNESSRKSRMMVGKQWFGNFVVQRWKFSKRKRHCVVQSFNKFETVFWWVCACVHVRALKNRSSAPARRTGIDVQVSPTSRNLRTAYD